MIDAPLAARRSGRAYFVTRKIPVTFIAKIRFHSSSDVPSRFFSI